MALSISFITSVLSLIYLFIIYNETKIDVFQQPFYPGEKQGYFKENVNMNPRFGYDQQCMKYQEVIMNPSTNKLGDVFNLNFESIHNKSFYIIIINLFIISFYIFLIIAFIIISCSPICAKLLSCIILFLSLAILFLMILVTILFVILLFSYYNGDTYSYYSFLKCKNVNYGGFSRYRVVEAFKSDFKLFMIFTIISLLASYLSDDLKGNENY